MGAPDLGLFGPFFLLNDRIKVLAYRILDPSRSLRNRQHPPTDMKLDTKEYRLRPGDKINLKEWPTSIKPLYKSKENYQERLQRHVEELSALSERTTHRAGMRCF